MANKVPDNFNFSLQDVVDVVQPSVHSLQECFDYSIDTFFDSDYEGSKEQLKNFRNYTPYPISLINYGRHYLQPDIVEDEIISGMVVPSDSEWNDLANYLINHYPSINENNIGNHLKHCRQINSPLGGSCNTLFHPRWDEDETHHGLNTVDFSVIPAGGKGAYNFSGMGEKINFWTRSSVGGSAKSNRSFGKSYGHIAGVTHGTSLYRFSVRCMRNATPEESAINDGIIVEKVTDYNGNIYDCIKIGDQIWTRQNLAATRYSNGSVLPSQIYSLSHYMFHNIQTSIWK